MSLEQGFNPNYFSLDEIIATQAKVTCETRVHMYNFGFLDPAQGTDDLPAGTSISVPLWVAAAMTKPSRKYFSGKIPFNYSEKSREILIADPNVVDLNRMGPNFYQTGLHLTKLPILDVEFLVKLLPDIFQKRLDPMLDSFSYLCKLHSVDENTAPKSGNLVNEFQLDALEKQMLTDAKDGASTLEKWLQRKK